MSSSEDRSSWDILRYSSDPSEMSDQVDANLEEAFERVENAIKNQLNHLRNLGEAINVIEREEFGEGSVIRRRPLPDSGAAKLSKREKLWKEGRRDLYRFVEDFEEQISARSFLHLRTVEKRPKLMQSPGLRAIPQEVDKGILVEPINFESPLRISKPVERYGKSGCVTPVPLSRAREASPPPQPEPRPPTSVSRAPEYFLPPRSDPRSATPLSRARESSSPPRPEPRPPTPPVPARNPSRRTSQINLPTGSVMLFNPPANFVANMLPEEHIQLAKAKQRESMLRAFDPDLLVRRGSSRTPESILLSPTGSSNTTPTRSPHRSRSASSLRLAAVAEEQPVGLIPLILTSSLRQTSRVQRPPNHVPYHSATLSTSLATKAFYDPTSPQNSDTRPISHLPPAIRDSSGLFASQPASEPEQTPTPTPPHSQAEDPKKAEADELQASHYQFVREKLTRNLNKAELQWNEANRMLADLPEIEDESLLLGEGKVEVDFDAEAETEVGKGDEFQWGRTRARGGMGPWIGEGEESMRTRIKNMWRSGTRKGREWEVEAVVYPPRLEMGRDEMCFELRSSFDGTNRLILALNYLRAYLELNGNTINSSDRMIEVIKVTS